MRGGVTKEDGRWRIDVGELPEDLVLEKLRVGKVEMVAGSVTIDMWKVRDVDGGEVWMPAMYEDKDGDGGAINPIDEEQRIRLAGFLENGWPMVLAVQLAFGEWDESVFGSKEKIVKKTPKEVAMVAVAGPDNRGKSTAAARLGADDYPYDTVDMDPFSAENQRAEAYLAKLAQESIVGGNANVVLPLVKMVREEKLTYLGPESLNGTLCRLVNIVLHPERRDVLVLDMPGLQARRESLEALDLFYLYAVPYIWYEGGRGESLEEKAESGLVWLKEQLPEKIEEFRGREEMFRAAVGSG